jgi:SAM-dependent methyltransferase
MNDKGTTASAEVRSILYPEIQAGGFSRIDGTIGFYARVNALLINIGSRAIVLDYGAGRGRFLEDPVAFRRDLRSLQGKVQKVVGIDIDDAVLRNVSVDEAHVIAAGEVLPLDDESIDLIVSDFTFEHITNPDWVSAEFDRVLRPGGWICARTPNKWGYIAIMARAVPNDLHEKVLRWFQPAKSAEDTFPTRYRLNTPKDLKQWFPDGRYEDFSYCADSEFAYGGGSLVAARIARVGFALVPSRWRSMFYIFLQKSVD